MLPYGQNAFHMGTILSTFSNPLAAALLLLIPLKKNAQQTRKLTYYVNRALIWLFLVFWLSMALAGWMIWIAFNSPCPVLVDSLAGTIMIVTSFTLFTFFVTLVKVSIANDLRNFQNKRFLRKKLNRFIIFFSVNICYGMVQSHSWDPFWELYQSTPWYTSTCSRHDGLVPHVQLFLTINTIQISRL